LTLDAAARRRFARHLLLAEIGELGQERLISARIRRRAGGDSDAYAVAADYLERAGCVPDPDGAEVPVPSATEVERFAASEALRMPAAMIAGAFAAVEHLKETLGIADARELPPDLRLSTEA